MTLISQFLLTNNFEYQSTFFFAQNLSTQGPEIRLLALAGAKSMYKPINYQKAV